MTKPRRSILALFSPRLIYYTRLALFALLSFISIYAILDIVLAGIYVYSLIHPGCQAPRYLEGVPHPQEVRLDTSDGFSLNAWYYPPRNGAAIVALGGIGGSLGDRLPPVAFLVRHGYGVLQIDSRACAYPAVAVTLGGKEADDASAALAYLRNRPEVKRIGVFGFSMGASGAILSAVQHKEILAVVAEGGYYNLGNDIIEPEQRKSSHYAAFLYSVAGMYWLQTSVNPWRVSPIERIGEISPRPILLIYGEHEADSGHAQMQFLTARQPKELLIIPGGDHGANNAIAPQEYQSHILNFFDKALSIAGVK